MLAIDPAAAGAHETFCAALAQCYRPPTTPGLPDRAILRMLESADLIDGDLARRTRELARTLDGGSRADLVADYRHLIDPRDPVAMPQASAWLDRLPQPAHEVMDALAAMYDEAAFHADADLADVADHVAVELAFLHLLVFRENQAQRIGTPEECEATSELRARFVDEHLRRWIGPFSSVLRFEARTPFYRELAGVTERLVAVEALAHAR